ncbi:uncharacterized protein LOC131404148 [Diceros bicornis minor]|uniref:uncharacterized protein LOC131404148 n=1 Tax=Diceros bicornis minor TaxID=77932 RepID=UPI0026F09C3D|nr:uncharacterized protein LOC131404148 [Diceros bicornis minor]
MDSGPVQALQLRDQPQPASAATGSVAANGAGRGLHVIASTFPGCPAAPAEGRGASAAARAGRPEGRVWRMRWPRVGDRRPEAPRRRAGAWGGEEPQPQIAVAGTLICQTATWAGRGARQPLWPGASEARVSRSWYNFMRELGLENLKDCPIGGTGSLKKMAVLTHQGMIRPSCHVPRESRRQTGFHVGERKGGESLGDEN